MDKLNEILIKARTSNDPKHRLEFYRILLKSNIYFLTNTVVNPGVCKASDISFSLLTVEKSNGEIMCPIFSSAERIQEAYPNNTYRFIGINARTFFYNFSGATLVLNPGCKVSKELLPDEVQSLLDGSLFVEVIQIPEQISLRQPMKLPVELIEVLKNCFSQHAEIFEAYFAEGSLSNEGAHPIIAVRGKGELMKVFSIAHSMVVDRFAKNQIIDFIDLEVTDLAEYFKDKKPFYIAQELSTSG